MRGTGTAFRPTVHPSTIKTGIGGAARLTHGAPPTLPVTVGYVVERWVHAINMIGYVAVVAENEAGFIVSLTATLTYCTVQTSEKF